MAASVFGAMAQDSNTVTLKGDNGNISAIYYKPIGFVEGQKCPIVIFFHGLGGSKDDANLRQVATGLQQKGVATFLFDFAGCGASEGIMKKQTPKSMFKDAKVVVDYVKELPFVKDIALCGYSYGGNVAIQVAADYGKGTIKAMALMAPLVSIREDIIHGTLLGHKVERNIELDETHVISKDFLEDVAEINIFKLAASYKGETYVVQGKEDKIVPYTYGEYLEVFMPKAKYEQFKGIDHNFSSDDAEKHAKAIGEVVNFLVKEVK